MHADCRAWSHDKTVSYLAGAGIQLSRVIDQDVLLEDFPLEDVLDCEDDYADAGVCFPS